jgi:hypothetical protein
MDKVSKVPTYDEKEEIKKETHVGTGSAKGSTLVIGRAKAGDAFSATVRRRGANVY